MKVFLVLTSDYVKTTGCFKTKKDCKKFINGSDSYVIKKLDVETYEPKNKKTLFERIKKVVGTESLFIVNEEGERIKIELSHTDGNNVVFKPEFNIEKTSCLFDRYMVDYRKDLRHSVKMDFVNTVPFDINKSLPAEGLKNFLINGIPHNVEYIGNGNYLVKDPVDFSKQMLEADKELQRVCKNQYYIMLEGKKYKIVKPFTFD